MKNKNIIKWYKVTDPNGECRGFKFEVGKTYKHKGDIELCKSGFHFCVIANNCFNYYDFDPNNLVFEIEASGSVLGDESDKSCTDNIKIIRQLTCGEVLDIVNTGKGNTGRSNAGSRNAGNDNAGNDNAGSRNAGSRNAGYANAGNDNAGSRNAGSYNAGSRNAGYANAGNDNAGAFNSLQSPYIMFNKPSLWKYEDFVKSKAYNLLSSIDTTIHVPEYQMSEIEKKENPYYVTTKGYVKQIPFKEAFQNSWNNWSDENHMEFMSLPNFDKKIFFEITGVKIK